MPLSLATPEDYGAVGDGTTNDTAALGSLFNGWAAGTARDDPIAFALSPRKIYRFSSPIVVTCGATGGNFGFRLYGNGAQLLYTGTSGYALQIGDLASGKKALYSHVTDLRIRADAGATADGLLHLSYGDFCLFENIVLNGASVTEAALRIQQNNSLTFTNVNTAGSPIGVLFAPNDSGPDPGAQNTAVFHWHGGKVQDHRVGIRHAGTVFTLRDIDLSFIGQWGIESTGSSGRIACYFEKPGTRKGESPVRGNTAGCVKLVGARGITVGGRINCTNGSVTDGTHAAYGVKCESGCEDIVVEGSGRLPQRMFVDASTDCRNVIVARQASCVLPVKDELGWEYPVPQPCPLDDVVRFHNLGAIYLKDPTDPRAPTSLTEVTPSNRNPAGLRRWTRTGVGLTSRAVRDYAGTGLADVLSFPPGTGNIVATYMGIAALEVYRFEMRARLVRFHPPRPTLRVRPHPLVPPPGKKPAASTPIAALDMEIRTSGESSTYKRVRLGPGWQDYVVHYTVPASMRMGLTFMLRHIDGPWEGFDVAIDFLRAYRLQPGLVIRPIVARLAPFRPTR